MNSPSLPLSLPTLHQPVLELRSELRFGRECPVEHRRHGRWHRVGKTCMHKHVLPAYGPEDQIGEPLDPPGLDNTRPSESDDPGVMC